MLLYPGAVTLKASEILFAARPPVVPSFISVVTAVATFVVVTHVKNWFTLLTLPAEATTDARSAARRDADSSAFPFIAALKAATSYVCRRFGVAALTVWLETGPLI